MKRYQIENIVPLIFSLFSLVLFFEYYQSSCLFFLGVVFVLVGLVLWWWGKITLGEYFTALPKASKLVTTGIYSKIRHPIYLGISFMILGYLLIVNNLIMLVVAGVVISSLVIRAYFEERLLLATFGKAYLDYRKRSWF